MVSLLTHHEPDSRFARSSVEPRRAFTASPVLPDALMSAILSKGDIRTVPAGDLPDLEDQVWVLLNGVVAAMPAPDASAGLLPLGHFALGQASQDQGPMRVILDARLLTAPADAVRRATAPGLLEDVLMSHALDQVRRLRTEVACVAKHTAQQRAATWLLRLAEATRSDSYRIRQSDVAALMGVRRSSLNMVTRPLQTDAMLLWRRGRVTLLDSRRLRAAACGCDLADVPNRKALRGESRSWLD